MPDNIFAFDERLQAHSDAFDDAVTQIMGEAFDAARGLLGGLNPEVHKTVAGRIIAEANRGERDPARLREAALAAFAAPASIESD